MAADGTRLPAAVRGGLPRPRWSLRLPFGPGRKPAQPSDAPAVAPPAGVLGWMGKLLRLDEPTGYTQATQYQRLLDQLQNSANILNQSERVNVRWARDGTVNRLATERWVHLDPDGLVGPEGEIDATRLEALTGRVYLASTLCSSVHPDAWAQAQELRGQPGAVPRIATSLWEALELRHAREVLARDWAGFSRSLAAESVYGVDTRERVQALLDSTARAPHADAAAVGMAWNLLHDRNPVSLPPAYAAAVAEAGAGLAVPPAAAQRCEAATEAARVLVRLLPADERGPARLPASHDRSLLGKRMLVVMEGLDRLTPADDDPSSMKVEAPKGARPPDSEEWRDMPAKGCEARYASRVKALQPAIRRVVASLLFNNTEPSFETYGHRRGELDEGSLHKLWLRDDRLMSRRDIKARKSVAVGILIDESGSMGVDSRHIKARDVAITLYEALVQVQGLQVSVYGHTTADRARHGSVLCLRSYVTPRLPLNAASMMRIDHCRENLDSWAALGVSRRLLQDFPRVDRRLLFVVSDGAPCGMEYGGKPAMEHLRKVVQASHARGVDIYGLGISKAFSPEEADRMYGPGRCVVLEDVESSVPVITRFLRQVTRTL